MFSIFSSIPFTYINITNKNNLSDKNKIRKHYHIMHIISFLVITSAIVITLGVYGIHLTNLFDYPLYTVLKQISLFNFLESIENASIMLWPLSLINASSIILLFIFNILDNITKNSNKIKPIITIISFLIPYFFLINNTIIETFEYLILPTIFNFLLLAIPVFALAYFSYSLGTDLPNCINLIIAGTVAELAFLGLCWATNLFTIPKKRQ